MSETTVQPQRAPLTALKGGKLDTPGRKTATEVLLNAFRVSAQLGDKIKIDSVKRAEKYAEKLVEQGKFEQGLKYAKDHKVSDEVLERVALGTFIHHLKEKTNAEDLLESLGKPVSEAINSNAKQIQAMETDDAKRGTYDYLHHEGEIKKILEMKLGNETEIYMSYIENADTNIQNGKIKSAGATIEDIQRRLKEGPGENLKAQQIITELHNTILKNTEACLSGSHYDKLLSIVEKLAKPLLTEANDNADAFQAQMITSFLPHIEERRSKHDYKDAEVLAKALDILNNINIGSNTPSELAKLVRQEGEQHYLATPA